MKRRITIEVDDNRFTEVVMRGARPEPRWGEYVGMVFGCLIGHVAYDGQRQAGVTGLPMIGVTLISDEQID